MANIIKKTDYIGGEKMKPRKQLGNKNTSGAKITKLREDAKMKQKDLLAKIQVQGVNISATSLSDLEGQNRKVSGEELKAIAKVFGVCIEDLLE